MVRKYVRETEKTPCGSNGPQVVTTLRTTNLRGSVKNLRDHVKRKALELQHIDTKEQIADIFTKGLGREAFGRLSERLMGEPHLHSLRTVAREE